MHCFAGRKCFLGEFLCHCLTDLGRQAVSPSSKQCDLQKKDALEHFMKSLRIAQEKFT
jgi:dTDP-4-dehydrorhamnose reductase